MHSSILLTGTAWVEHSFWSCMHDNVETMHPSISCCMQCVYVHQEPAEATQLFMYAPDPWAPPCFPPPPPAVASFTPSPHLAALFSVPLHAAPAAVSPARACSHQLPSVDSVEYWRAPDKAGWLQSQSEVMKMWRRRWFVLKQGYLFRFLSPDVSGVYVVVCESRV